MSSTVMTPIGILMFPALFAPKVNTENPNQAPRYSAMIAFDKAGVGSSAYQDLRRIAMEAIEKKFGAAKAADANFVRSLRLPFRNASEKTYNGLENADVFINAWRGEADGAPGVVDLQGTKILVPNDVFAGQMARATVRAFAYDSNGNKGVSFALEHVQIVKADMPRLDGRVAAEDAFAQADNSQLAALGIDVNAPASGGSGAGDTTNFPF